MTPKQTVWQLAIWAAVAVLGIYYLIGATEIVTHTFTVAFTDTLPVGYAVSPVEETLAGLAESGVWVFFALLTAITIACVGRLCLSDTTNRLGESGLPLLVRRLILRASVLLNLPKSAIRLSLAGIYRPLLLFAPRRIGAPTPAALAGAVPLLI